MQWITFQMELFARNTLCNIVLDLCTLHTQTQTDIACILFSPGGISVSEMKQTANISCLLHCRYYAVSTGAGAWTTVRGWKIHTTAILISTLSLMNVSHTIQIQVLKWVWKKKPQNVTLFSISINTVGCDNDIRSQHGCYLSLTCIWISPQMDVAGNRARKTRQGRCPLPLLVFLTCLSYQPTKYCRQPVPGALGPQVPPRPQSHFISVDLR